MSAQDQSCYPSDCLRKFFLNSTLDQSNQFRTLFKSNFILLPVHSVPHNRIRIIRILEVRSSIEQRNYENGVVTDSLRTIPCFQKGEKLREWEEEWGRVKMKRENGSVHILQNEDCPPVFSIWTDGNGLNWRKKTWEFIYGVNSSNDVGLKYETCFFFFLIGPSQTRPFQNDRLNYLVY